MKTILMLFLILIAQVSLALPTGHYKGIVSNSQGTSSRMTAIVEKRKLSSQEFELVISFYNSPHNHKSATSWHRLVEQSVSNRNVWAEGFFQLAEPGQFDVGTPISYFEPFAKKPAIVVRFKEGFSATLVHVSEDFASTSEF